MKWVIEERVDGVDPIKREAWETLAEFADHLAGLVALNNLPPLVKLRCHLRTVREF